jgi:hypothetical protein
MIRSQRSTNPSGHFAEAEHLIDAAESSAKEVTAAAALLAVAQAVLPTVWKRALPKRRLTVCPAPDDVRPRLVVVRR